MQWASAILSSIACLARAYFSSLSHKRHDLRGGGRVIKPKVCVLLLSASFVWNVFHSKKNSATYYHTCAQVFMYSNRYYCEIWIKLEFSRQIFEKYSNIKLCENSCSGRNGCSMRTDRQTHDEASSRFPNFANSPKSSTLFCINFRSYTVFPTLIHCINIGWFIRGNEGPLPKRKRHLPVTGAKPESRVLSSSNEHALQAGEAAGEASCTAGSNEHAL